MLAVQFFEVIILKVGPEQNAKNDERFKHASRNKAIRTHVGWWLIPGVAISKIVIKDVILIKLWFILNLVLSH